MGTLLIWIVSMHKNNCRVCGFELPEPPWGEDGETPTWEICPCCGTEFGYEDCTVQAAKKRRAQWLASGANWFNEALKPSDWLLERQLADVPDHFL